MIELFYPFIIIIFSIIIHEYCHAWMADYLGDSTAKDSGRLTLNPISHIDLFGSILLPLLLLISKTGFIFGWAKPVPFNPYNLRNQKYGPALVAIAGPLANLLVAFLFALIIRFFPFINPTFFLGIIYYNILLAIFNLIPIPPLDGSKILFAALPSSARNFQIFLEQYGFFILIFFIFFVFQIISPIISLIFKLFVGY